MKINHPDFNRREAELEKILDSKLEQFDGKLEVFADSVADSVVEKVADEMERAELERHGQEYLMGAEQLLYSPERNVVKEFAERTEREISRMNDIQKYEDWIEQVERDSLLYEPVEFWDTAEVQEQPEPPSEPSEMPEPPEPSDDPHDRPLR